MEFSNFQESLTILQQLKEEIANGGNLFALRKFFPKASLMECREIWECEALKEARKIRDENRKEETTRLENSREALEFYLRKKGLNPANYQELLNSFPSLK